MPGTLYRPGERAAKTYRVGVKFKHKTREGPTLSGTLETERHTVHAPGGYYLRHDPVYTLHASSLRNALKQVRSATVTIGVVGELASTPDQYEEEEYPPFQRTFLARVKSTQSTWAVLRNLPDDWYQIRQTLSDLTGFDWSKVETVYFTERPPVYKSPVVG